MSRAWTSAWKRRLGPLLGVVLFAFAIGVLHHVARGTDFPSLRESIRAISWLTIGAAVALTGAGYLVLTLYDQLACRHAGHPLPWRRVAMGSFIGHAFTHTLGNALLVGGSVRYRLYSASGLSAVEIALVIAFCFVGFWVGFLALAGMVFVIEPPPLVASLHLPFASARVLGGLFLIVPGAWLIASIALRRPLTIKGWSLRMPTPAMSAAQIALGAIEMSLRGLVLYILLPADIGLSYPAFLGAYLLAMVAGKISQVPGGLGVLEGVFLVLVPAAASSPATLGALAVYRGVYYLVPLMAAALMLGCFELSTRAENVRGAVAGIGSRFGLAVRHIMAACAVLAGATLVLGSVLPSDPARAQQLALWVPPMISESAHALCGALGMALLFAARGLQRKLLAAWRLSALLLVAGAALSLLRGFAWEEAAALLLLLTALLPCRRDFHRGIGLGSVEFIPGWIACFALVLLAAAGCGAFAYKHVEWSAQLWTTFAPGDDAARALRAFAAALAATAAVACARAFKPDEQPIPPPSAAELERAARIAHASPDTLANLALLGDKQLLFSEDGEAFVMYRVEGRSYVALGDPVGPPEQRLELAWRFRELCDHHDGRPVFYQVRECSLYADLGLSPVAIGDEARVPLAFHRIGGSLASVAKPGRLEEIGCALEVVPPELTLALLPELKRVADAWIAAHPRQADDGFAHGHFDPSWLARFPTAVVRQAGVIVAFASVWTASARTELSLDLVRIAPDAPQGLLAPLFDAVMAWGHAEGFTWFSLGMAPLRGVSAPTATGALAMTGARLGRRVFAHGEHFASLAALRSFMETFHPVWEPRYLFSRGDLQLPRVIHDIVALAAPGQGAQSLPLEAASA